MEETPSLLAGEPITCFPLPLETVSQFRCCHSAQAQRDAESSLFNEFWIPASAAMT